MTQHPRSRSVRIRSSSWVISCAVSVEVGSSITMTLASRASERRISTFCLSAILRSRTLA